MSIPNPSANRYLADKAMDHIDHALGRPSFPLRESYRNYFATPPGSADARAFAASPHWELRNTDGNMAYYSVTEAGRQALARHLASLGLDSVFVVYFDGHDQIVPAATRGKARYAYWTRIADALGDMTFGQFARQTRVRRAA